MRKTIIFFIFLSIYGCTTTQNHYHYKPLEKNKKSSQYNRTNSMTNEKRVEQGKEGVTGSLGRSGSEIPSSVYDEGFFEKALFNIFQWCITSKCGDNAVLRKYSSIKEKNRRNVYFHTYKKITNLQQEPEARYGLYTYILINKIPMEFNKNLKLKSETILDIVKGNIEEKKLISVSINPIKTNIFLIPYNNLKTNSISISEYNHPLSIRTSMIISGKYKKGVLRKKLSKEGPFLITTKKPIHLIKPENINMMIVDFSNTEPAATKEIMLSYMERLESNIYGTNDFSSFEKIKADLISKIISFNSSIELISTSLAGE